MLPDDVQGAVDELVAAARVPGADTAAIVARGRKRVHQRWAALAGGAVLVIAVLGVVTALARADHTTRARTDASRPPTTIGVATPTTDRTGEVLDIAVASSLEAWKCTNPLQYTSDGGSTWTTITTAGIRTGADTSAANPNSACAAVPGGNVWIIQPGAARSGGWPLLRVRGGNGASVLRFPFGRRGLRPLAITFLDARHGWILTISDLASGLDLPIRSLFRTGDGGRTWSIVSENVPVTGDLQFTSPTRGWALTSAFGLATTRDGGAHWHSVALPAAPAGAFIAGVVAHGESVVAWRGAITGVTTPTFFDASADGGRSWARRPGPRRLDLTGATPLAFEAVDSMHWRLYAGRLWSTDDGARTWREEPARAAAGDSRAFLSDARHRLDEREQRPRSASAVAAHRRRWPHVDQREQGAPAGLAAGSHQTRNRWMKAVPRVPCEFAATNSDALLMMATDVTKGAASSTTTTGETDLEVRLLRCRRPRGGPRRGQRGLGLLVVGVRARALLRPAPWRAWARSTSISAASSATSERTITLVVATSTKPPCTANRSCAPSASIDAHRRVGERAEERRVPVQERDLAAAERAHDDHVGLALDTGPAPARRAARPRHAT